MFDYFFFFFLGINLLFTDDKYLFCDNIILLIEFVSYNQQLKISLIEKKDINIYIFYKK